MIDDAATASVLVARGNGRMAFSREKLWNHKGGRPHDGRLLTLHSALGSRGDARSPSNLAGRQHIQHETCWCVCFGFKVLPGLGTTLGATRPDFH